MARSASRDSSRGARHSYSSEWHWYSVVPVALFAISQVFLYLVFPQVVWQLLYAAGDPGAGASVASDLADDRLAWLVFKCSLCISIPTLIVTGIYGQIAEKWGCLYTTVIPALGQTVYVTSVLICCFLHHNGINNVKCIEYLIMVGSLTYGLSGSRSTYTMSMFTLGSYVTADDDQRRSQIFGEIDAGLYTAAILGPGIVTFCTVLLSHTTSSTSTSLLLLMICNFAVCVLAVWSIFALLPTTHTTTTSPTKRPTSVNLALVFAALATDSNDSDEDDINIKELSSGPGILSLSPVQGAEMRPSSISSGLSLASSLSAETPQRLMSIYTPTSCRVREEDPSALELLPLCQPALFHQPSSSPSPPLSPRSAELLRTRAVSREAYITSPDHQFGDGYGSMQLDDNNVDTWIGVGTPLPPEAKVRWNPLLTFEQVLNLFNNKHLMSLTPFTPSAKSPRSPKAAAGLGAVFYYPLPYLAICYFLLHTCSSADGLTRLLFLRLKLHFNQGQIDLLSAITGSLFITSILVVPQLVHRALTSATERPASDVVESSNDEVIPRRRAVSSVAVEHIDFGSMMPALPETVTKPVASPCTTMSSPQRKFTLTLGADLAWAAAALTARGVYYAGFGLLSDVGQLPLLLPIILFCGPAVPRLRACLSKSVPLPAVADVFVAVSALEAIAEIASPLFAAVFAVSTEVDVSTATHPGANPSVADHEPWIHFPGLCFELVSVVCVLSLLALLAGNRAYLSRLRRHRVDISKSSSLSDIPSSLCSCFRLGAQKALLCLSAVLTSVHAYWTQLRTRQTGDNYEPIENSRCDLQQSA
jgi:hypothetical protein